MKDMECEELFAIPQSEYKHLKQCKNDLIGLHEQGIKNLYNEMQIQSINSIVNSFIK